MSQPELGWDDEERALLESAELDAPLPGAKNRTLAALGVGGAALGTAVTAGSAKAAAVSAGKGLGLSKLLAVLVIGGTASGAALHYRAQFNAEKARSAQNSSPSRPAAKLAEVAAAPVAPTVPFDASRSADSDATAPTEVLPSAPKAPAAPASARTAPDIALEIASLDRARRASERGDFGGALTELDQYDHTFKQGRLRPEALLLRIQTLISKGDVVGARALGSRFLAHYPKSPLSPRIQKLIGGTP
jgi:TolA-binding protein